MGCKHVWLDVSWSIIYPSLFAMFIKCSNCFGRVLNQHSVCMYIAYIWEGNRYSALFNLKCIRAKANRWTQLFITAHCHNSIPGDLTSESRANPIIENALLDWHSKMMCRFHLFSSAFLLFSLSFLFHTCPLLNFLPKCGWLLQAFTILY